MIVTLTLKTPDVLDYALEGIKDEDEKALAKEACEKFVQYGEYVRVGIDTKSGAAWVVPV